MRSTDLAVLTRVSGYRQTQFDLAGRARKVRGLPGLIRTVHRRVRLPRRSVLSAPLKSSEALFGRLRRRRGIHLQTCQLLGLRYRQPYGQHEACDPAEQLADHQRQDDRRLEVG